MIVNNNLKQAREKLNKNKFDNSLNEDKIDDLLHLANKELDLKSQKISEVKKKNFNFYIIQLTSKLEDLELKNLKKFNKNKLNELKNFYSDGLGKVIEALNNMK